MFQEYIIHRQLHAGSYIDYRNNAQPSLDEHLLMIKQIEQEKTLDEEQNNLLTELKQYYHNLIDQNQKQETL